MIAPLTRSDTFKRFFLKDPYAHTKGATCRTCQSTRKTVFIGDENARNKVVNWSRGLLLQSRNKRHGQHGQEHTNNEQRYPPHGHLGLRSLLAGSLKVQRMTAMRASLGCARNGLGAYGAVDQLQLVILLLGWIKDRAAHFHESPFDHMQAVAVVKVPEPFLQVIINYGAKCGRAVGELSTLR